jgi:hypothetical protein
MLGDVTNVTSPILSPFSSQAVCAIRMSPHRDRGNDMSWTNLPDCASLQEFHAEDEDSVVTSCPGHVREPDGILSRLK